MKAALTKLQSLVPKTIPQGEKMSSPTGTVTLLQSDIDGWTSSITAAVGVLAAYIKQLIAGQATPLPAADEANIDAAIASLLALEPPAPTPAP